MSRLSRRALLVGAAAVLLGRPAAASAPRRRDQQRFLLPPEFRGVLPGQVQQGMALVEAVIALQQEAGRKGLPDTLLSLGMLARGLPDAERLYLSTMPHLVALVARGELGRDRAFADKAGALLYDLNLGQRVPPAAVRTGAAGMLRYASLQNADVSSATSFAALADEYERLFDSLVLRPGYAEEAAWHLKLMRDARPRYEWVSQRTGVPWFVIGAIHGLEASFNFRGHLHNGDFPLNARTRNVPAGRPKVWLPPVDWQDSAIDALRFIGFADERDWSLAQTLYRIEGYNGFGYRRRGVPTPYLWSFGNHYERGKFIADGRWDARAVSQQCGAAMMLKLLRDAGEIRLDA